MIDMLSKSETKVSLRVRESDFISCPSGDLNIVVKSVSSANSQMFSASKFVKFELVSEVSKECVLLPNDNQPDTQNSLLFNNYSLRESDDFNKILLNHVTNFLTRHINDKVVISLYNDSQVIAQTSFEMSNL
jgi:hypothetical protein